MAAPALPAERGARSSGFSFIEVMIAMAILAVGSVSILSLLSLGVYHQIQRRTEERIQSVESEVALIVQAAVDRSEVGKKLKDLENVELSDPRYLLDVKWLPRPGRLVGWFAQATIKENGRAIRVLGPIPVVKSTLDPKSIVAPGSGGG